MLFNLVKRPEAGTRERILGGLHWLLYQESWSSARIEEEVGRDGVSVVKILPIVRQI